jgi:hypothetical protein
MATVRIPLIHSKHPGHVALIDEGDYEHVRVHRWYYAPPHGTNRTGYAATTIRVEKGKWRSIGMHRFVMDAPPKLKVDHENGNGLDNRRTNLRYATTMQNNANAAAYSNSKSGYRGVYWTERDHAWAATIHLADRVYFLGRYATAEEAARVYDAKAREFFGEFARLNLPESEGLPLPERIVRPKTSTYRGVSWCQRKKTWRVTFHHGGRSISVGSFHDPIDAARAYDAKARELKGEHAFVNFPD